MQIKNKTKPTKKTQTPKNQIYMIPSIFILVKINMLPRFA